MNVWLLLTIFALAMASLMRLMINAWTGKAVAWKGKATLLLMGAFCTFAFALDIYARAGGGGSRGGRCGLLCFILVPFFLAYAWYINRRIDKKAKIVAAALKKMSAKEPNWSEENLCRMAREKFVLLQTAWGNQDLVKIKQLLHPTLYPSWEQKINQQISVREKNMLAGLSINRLRIVDVRNYQDDELDEFTICIDASAEDQFLRDNLIVGVEKEDFREFWTFEWEKGEWLLREVVQTEGWKRFVPAAIIYEAAASKDRP